MAEVEVEVDAGVVEVVEVVAEDSLAVTMLLWVVTVVGKAFFLKAFFPI
jgi:hypothetical protein